jgi:hypothetical protein
MARACDTVRRRGRHVHGVLMGKNEGEGVDGLVFIE